MAYPKSIPTRRNTSSKSITTGRRNLKGEGKALTGTLDPMKVLRQAYRDANTRSRAIGQAVSYRVDVDPDGTLVWMFFEETSTAPKPVAEEAVTPDPELENALAAARARGRLRAADILSGADMQSAQAFAKTLGTSRVTINTKRQSGHILGLDGAKRGFRFPIWQLDAEGKPYAELATLHERLGGPWAVYRFLVQPHGELDGLTGREALERGKVNAVLKAAESVGKDFR
jgi:hypothetical protein